MFYLKFKIVSFLFLPKQKNLIVVKLQVMIMFFINCFLKLQICFQAIIPIYIYNRKMLVEHKYSTLGTTWNKLNVWQMFYCNKFNTVGYKTKCRVRVPCWETDPKMLLTIVPSAGWYGSVGSVPACEPKSHWFNSHSRAHAWVMGQVPSRGRVRGNHRFMFLSLPSLL